MRSILQTACATAVFVTVALTSLASQAQQYTLKYGHTTAATDISDDHIAALWLKDYLERNSGGRIKVEIYPAGQLGDFRQMLEQVQLGTLEMTQSTGGGISSFFPEIQVLDIPYILPNDMVTSRLADSAFFDKMRKAVLDRTKNLRLITVANTGNWRSFVTTKPVPNVAALSSLKIRTIDSPMQINFTKSLGANPTPVPWPELYSALQTGVVDGTKNSMADVMRFNLGEVLKYAFIDRHSFLYGYFWLSDSWLKSLPPELQELVVEGIQQAASIQARINERDESIYSKKFEEAGGKIYLPSDEDREKMKAAREEAEAAFVAEYGKEWVDALNSAIMEIETEIKSDTDRIIGRSE